jgi:hypothetical protein
MTNMTGSKLSICSHPGKITGYWITTKSFPTDCPRVVVRTNGNDIGVDNRKNEDDFIRRVLHLIFLRCHVNCDGQRLKYITYVICIYRYSGINTLYNCYLVETSVLFISCDCML